MTKIEEATTAAQQQNLMAEGNGLYSYAYLRTWYVHTVFIKKLEYLIIIYLVVDDGAWHPQ